MITSRLFSVLITTVVLAGLSATASASTQPPEKYRIIVERLGDGQASLSVVVDGTEKLSAAAREDVDPANRIPARQYTGCSATKLKSSAKPGVFIPDDQTGRKGIFIRDVADRNPGGAIAVDEKVMGQIDGLIKEKDARNVSITVRSEEVSKSLAVFRLAVLESEEELQALRAGGDKDAIKKGEIELTRLRNMLYLQQLAERCGALDDLVHRDMLLQEICKFAKDKIQKGVTKAAIKKVVTQLLKKVGVQAVKGFAVAAGVLVDLLWPSKLDRDPDEVFRDLKSSDLELNSAIIALMSVDIVPNNQAAMDRSYMLLLKRLGYSDCGAAD